MKDTTIKIGMMSFAHMHAASYANAVNTLPGAALIGIADHDGGRAEEMARTFDTSAFPTYETLLAADLDAVIVGSENCLHRDLTLMAAAAGKHVLCEKPISTTVEEAVEMIDACRTSGVQLMTAFPCRYSPSTLHFKARIDAGCVGDILAIKGTNHGKMPGGWFIEKEKSGGGAVIDHTVHVVDLMRWITRSEAKTVYAEISNLMNHDEYDDCGILTIDFENGVYSTLDTSWTRPKSFPTWGDVTMEAVGTKGMIRMDMFGQTITHYDDRTMAAGWISWGADMDRAMIEDFVSAIAAGRQVSVTGEDGLRALEVALAAYRSSESGMPVDLET